MTNGLSRLAAGAAHLELSTLAECRRGPRAGDGREIENSSGSIPLLVCCLEASCTAATDVYDYSLPRHYSPWNGEDAARGQRRIRRTGGPGKGVTANTPTPAPIRQQHGRMSEPQAPGKVRHLSTTAGRTVRGTPVVRRAPRREHGAHGHSSMGQATLKGSAARRRQGRRAKDPTRSASTLAPQPRGPRQTCPNHRRPGYHSLAPTLLTATFVW